MRILHVITTLSVGGAETMLRNVALGLPTDRYSQRVVSLTTHEPVGTQLESAGIPVMAPGGRKPWGLPALAMSAFRWVREWRPDLVHCWMYHSNVFGRALVAMTSSQTRPALLASVRGALNSPSAQRRALRAVRWLDARTSRRADALLFNSNASAAQHQAIGYSPGLSLVIPNGFDTVRFAPNAEVRSRVRGELGFGDELIIGMVARYEPVKGHAVLLQAVKRLAGLRTFRVVLVGRNCDDGNVELRRLISELGIGESMVLLGERANVPELLNAFDISVCPSLSESFPNAVGEAMARALPCVVTDVGDCAYLVSDTGRVAPSADPDALAARIFELLSMPEEDRRLLGQRARARIVEHFSMQAVLDQYAALYERIVASRRRPA